MLRCHRLIFQESSNFAGEFQMTVMDGLSRSTDAMYRNDGFKEPFETISNELCFVFLKTNPTYIFNPVPILNTIYSFRPYFIFLATHTIRALRCFLEHSFLSFWYA